MPAENVDPLAGKRIETLAWRRVEVNRLDQPVGFLPEQFILSEQQSCCEQLLGRRLDKSSFRRKLADRQVVEPVEGVMRTGANRPAQIYRLHTR